LIDPRGATYAHHRQSAVRRTFKSERKVLSLMQTRLSRLMSVAGSKPEVAGSSGHFRLSMIFSEKPVATFPDHALGWPQSCQRPRNLKYP
jgi:hypothetical protein